MTTVLRSQLQVVDPASVRMQGFAAVTGNRFSQHGFFGSTTYLIEPGAFESVLKRLDEPLPIFWSHGLEGIQIGETTKVEETDEGLWFEGQAFATSEALDVLAVMDGRKRIGASFSFDWGERVEDDDGVVRIKSFSEIHELGPTTWGANPRAYAETVPIDSIAIPEPASEPVEQIAQPIGEGADLAATMWRAVAALRRF